MKISFVVAASENGVIGVHGQLPWHLSEDLKFFKKNTLGKPIIMGRKTFESFGRPLPKRTNIILSKTLSEAPKGTVLFDDMEKALTYTEEKGQEEICIIGGGQIFKSYRHLPDEIILTRVHTQVADGETFFDLPEEKDWVLIWSEDHYKDEKHKFAFTFERWVRR